MYCSKAAWKVLGSAIEGSCYNIGGGGLVMILEPSPWYIDKYGV